MRSASGGDTRDHYVFCIPLYILRTTIYCAYHYILRTTVYSAYHCIFAVYSGVMPLGAVVVADHLVQVIKVHILEVAGGTGRVG